MPRIRVDSIQLRIEAGFFDSQRFLIGKAGCDVENVTPSMPSYDGQLSGPARTAGMEMRSRTSALSVMVDDHAQRLKSLADFFEAADNTQVDVFQQILTWLGVQIAAAQSLFLLPALNTPPLLGPESIQIPMMTPTFAPASTHTLTLTPTQVKNKKPVIYIVQSGDTLTAIAAHAGLSVESILRLNPQIKDPNRIQVGDEILIPADDLIPEQKILPTKGLDIGEGIGLMTSPARSLGINLIPSSFDKNHPGLDIWSTVKIIFSPFQGEIVSSDTCPGCLDKEKYPNNHDGQLNPLDTDENAVCHDPAVNYGFGACLIVEYKYEDLTPAQVEDINSRLPEGKKLEPGNSIYMMLAHLDRNQTIPAAGTKFKSGEEMAMEGTTGHSTGLHVHIEVAVARSGQRPKTGNTAQDWWVIAGPNSVFPGSRVDPEPIVAAS